MGGDEKMGEETIITPTTVREELTQDEKAYAGLSHALMISTWWIGPLVILLMKKESRFVKFHALQALFWQIIFTSIYFVGMAIVFAVMFTMVLTVPQGKATQPPQFPVAMFVAFPIYWLMIMVGMAISLTLAIMYCLRAMRGQWAGYPIIGRWARRIVGE
jgi:uncharacterized Tic20 family protein